MKIKAEQLRRSVPIALRKQGYSQIERLSGPGIVPGARLRAVKEGQPVVVAVRTSSDREIGLLRTPEGRWRTIPHVDLVVAAVPANDAPAVEVSAFESGTVLAAFDARVQELEAKTGMKLEFKAPVFLRLDDVATSKSKSKSAGPGLMRQAIWRSAVPINSLEREMAAVRRNDADVTFMDRLRAQVADHMGIDPANVEITISIKS
jgi:hypothetical protein